MEGVMHFVGHFGNDALVWIVHFFYNDEDIVLVYLFGFPGCVQ